MQKSVCLFAISTFFCMSSWTSASLSLLHTLDDPNPEVFGEFGYSLAIDSNRVLIGAIGDNTNGFNVGLVHLYDSVTGSLLHTFDDPTITSEDHFGYGVAITDEYVLIGSPGDDTAKPDAGEAHLFDTKTGDLLHTFYEPVPDFNADFGNSVAVDGNFLLIGAPSSSGPGSAHLFDAVTGTHLQTFNDPHVFRDLFGYSVALHGNYVLIGDPADNTNGDGVGQSHLFDATTGALLHTFNDPTPTNADVFGVSVAISDNYILIGAPNDDTIGDNVGQAHLFDPNSGSLLHTFNDPRVTGNDFFGDGVAVDGNHVLIGAPQDSGRGGLVGQAYLFDAASGNLIVTIDAPTPSRGSLFGAETEIDGNNILIGAFRDSSNGEDRAGRAYLFELRIPEPSTFSLALAALCVAFRRRR